MGFLSVLSFAHFLVKERVRPGDTVIDCTAGNGNDTLFLARQVGPEGKVYAFDIQQEALNQTRRRLEKSGVMTDSRVQLVQQNHAQLSRFIPTQLSGTIAAVMFNLGYLPGGDHSIITGTETTLSALDDALRLIRPGGIITAVLYPGHEGGRQEAEAVVAWSERLPHSAYQVLRYDFVNRLNNPPFLIAVEKR
jgi:predicted methyltransferase